MADVRALLAAERQARRISHPFLTYTKSSQLLCNVCQLNIKSEALWEGHLRSANHRKNAAKVAEEKSAKSLKRKLDDVEESDEDAGPLEDDARKKPKSRAVSHAQDDILVNGKARNGDGTPPPQKSVQFDVQDPSNEDSMQEMPVSEPPPPLTEPPPVEDDEMAAFEKEIASLEHQPDYSAATITAAPVSAAELEEEDKRRQQELEVEDEIDEQARRIEEEFEVMEDLEERIRKLKERREALRTSEKENMAADNEATNKESESASAEPVSLRQDDDSENDDDADDWYS